MGTTSDLREMVEDNQSGTHFQQHSSIQLGTAARCLTVFVRPLRTDRDIQLRGNGFGGNAPWVNFDLNNGVVAAQSTSSGTSNNGIAWSMGTPFIEKHANGWYRIGLTNLAVASFTWRLGLYIVRKNTTVEADSFTGDGQASFSCWGLQYEVGVFPTSYIHNETGSSVTRSADLASISGDKFGTYRTNLQVKSEHLWDSSTWQVVNSATGNSESILNVLTPYAYPNPIDGRYNANLVHRRSTDYWYIYSAFSAPQTTGFSIYVKPVSNPCIVQLFTQRGDNGRANFDLINKTHGGDGTRSITEVGNGWLRLEWIATTAAMSPSYVGINLRSDSLTTSRAGGTGTNVKFYAYAPQVEDNSVTNYIPSTETFTSRLSNATYVDSNGLIKTAYRNYARDTDWDSNWTVVSMTISSTNNIVNPFGTYDNVIQTDQNAAGQAIVYQGAGQVIKGTFSVYAKAGAKDKLNIKAQLVNSTLSNAASFDLSNGTLQTTHNDSTASIEDVGNGWYRCSVVSKDIIAYLVINPHDQASPTYSPGGRISSSVASGGLYLYGPQLVDSTTEAGEFTHNFSATQSGAPRYSHDPVTLVPTGLFLEPAATNLYIVNTVGNNSTLTFNAAIAPNGNMDAILVKANSGTSTNAPAIAKTLSNTSATGTEVFSAYAKAGTSNIVSLRLFKGARRIEVTFTLSGEGSFDITRGEAGIQNVGNGWYRIWGYRDATTNTSNYLTRVGVGNVDGGTYTGEETIYLWGIQFEHADTYAIAPSSYIYTDSSAATRAADTYTSTATTVLDRDGGNKESFFKTNTFTGFAHSEVISNGQYGRFFSINRNGAEKFTMFNFPSNLNIQMRTRHDTDYDYLETPLISDKVGTDLKLVTALAVNDGKTAHNGVLTGGDTSVTTWENVTGVPNEMYIGSAGSSAAATLNEPLRRLTFWKTRLPDGSLINITKL